MHSCLNCHFAIARLGDARDNDALGIALGLRGRNFSTNFGVADRVIVLSTGGGRITDTVTNGPGG